VNHIPIQYYYYYFTIIGIMSDTEKYIMKLAFHGWCHIQPCLCSSNISCCLHVVIVIVCDGYIHVVEDCIQILEISYGYVQ